MSLLVNVKSVVPGPVRNHLSSGKWLWVRLPFELQYRAALLLNAPLEQQVSLLPAPVSPPVYWVALKDIKLHASLCFPHGRLCMPGNWDTELVHALPSVFEAIPENAKKWDLHETVRSMFLKGQHYSTTPQYKAMINAVEQGQPNPPQGCRSRQEVDGYFERLIHAFTSMETDGYLTQKELGNSSVCEMRLHITRHGKLCLGGGGNHRIRMAEILGISWVPFLLRGVHPLWLIHLSRHMQLPPHKALTMWMNDTFYNTKPATLT
jgi:hypothetical protein